MNKVIARGIKEISKIAKQVAENSPNTISAFLYYEPKAPRGIMEKIRKSID